MSKLEIKFDEKKRSPKTIKTYQQDLKSLSKLFPTKEDLFNVDNVMSVLKKHYTSNHTIKNKLAIISLFIKCLDDFPEKVAIRTKYIREIKVLDFDIAKQNAKHMKTIKQQDNWITKQDWDDMLKHYKPDPNSGSDMGGNMNKVRDYIVLSIYSQVALRNDLVDMIILPSYKYDDYAKDNCINNILVFDEDNETCKLVLNRYKTSKIYGQNHIDINEVDDLCLFAAYYYYSKQEIHDDDDMIIYLLSKVMGDPISTPAFCKYFKGLGKCINKELTTTTIRHCAVSEIYDIEKLKKVAKRMGHSINEAISVYAKI